LAGQPELADRLNAVNLRQLKQRVGLRCVLGALDVRETAAYIAGRIRLAGGVAGQLFTREAVLAVHEHSRGIPRVINVICDNALLAGFASNRRPIASEIIADVCRDFDLNTGDDETVAESSGSAAKSPGILLIDPPQVERKPAPPPDGSLFETVAPAAQPPSVAQADSPMFGTLVTKRRFFLLG
jgi:hypothetical protein